MPSSTILSAQQRLADSRQAIVRHMNHDTSTGSGPEHSDGVSDQDVGITGSNWDLTKQVIGAWWRSHPAHIAADLVRPMIQTFAQENPVKLLGISAAVGAAAVVIRPWRFFSITGLLLATLKSTDITAAVKTLLAVGKQDQIR